MTDPTDSVRYAFQVPLASNSGCEWLTVGKFWSNCGKKPQVYYLADKETNRLAMIILTLQNAKEGETITLVAPNYGIHQTRKKSMTIDFRDSLETNEKAASHETLMTRLTACWQAKKGYSLLKKDQ